MAVPQILFVQCPGCEVTLELNTISWQLALAEVEAGVHGYETGGHGIALNITAFGPHACWSEDE